MNDPNHQKQHSGERQSSHDLQNTEVRPVSSQPASAVRYLVLGLGVLLFFGIVYSIFMNKDNPPTQEQDERERAREREIDNTSVPADVQRKLSDFNTDLSMHSIDFDDILSGGPGKDGIPAINEPKFESLSETSVADDAQGILVDSRALSDVREGDEGVVVGGEQRWYPYSIIVWHEIVNDEMVNTEGDVVPYAVTFCPLCGSAILFDRQVSGVGNAEGVSDAVLTFGVSGFLNESNLLMYDDLTESLWAQAKGEAVVGDYTGQKLDILPMQLITLAEVREKYPTAKVLSDDTGYRRNYTQNPYTGYEDTEQLVFPASGADDVRFGVKEIMYVVPYEGGQYALDGSDDRKDDGVPREVSIAMNQIDLASGDSSEFEVDGVVLRATRDGGEIRVVVVGGDGENENTVGDDLATLELPGYYEMWFSWVSQHEDDGLVWEVE